VFNPGSIGPRRNDLPIVFGVLEIAGGKLSLRHIDCETGQPWSP
jgi:predicted phosphodiesterase